MSEQKAADSPIPAKQNPVVSSAAPSQVDPIQFHSSGIGTQTVRPQDPFAEQNRVRAIEKRQQKKNRKKFFIIGGIVVGLALIALTIFLVIKLATPAEQTIVPNTPEGMQMWASGQATKLGEDAQKIYGVDLNSGATEGDETSGGSGTNQGDVGAVKDYFNQQFDATDNESEKVAVKLIEMEFYDRNELPDYVVEIGSGLNVEKMTFAQFDLFCSLMFEAYLDLDNEEKAYEYLEMTPPQEAPVEDQLSEKEES